MSRGTSTRYELGASADTESAVWAPDGRSIIFSSGRAGQMEDIYEKELGGAGRLSGIGQIQRGEESFELVAGSAIPALPQYWRGKEIQVVGASASRRPEAAALTPDGI